MADPRAYDAAGGVDDVIWHTLGLLVGGVLLSAVLAWLCALISYVFALPLFVMDYPDALHFAWHGGSVDTSSYQAYERARNLVMFLGALTGIMSTQTYFVIRAIKGLAIRR